MNSPKVTVLMPVYNTEKYLRDAIESILDQTYSDFDFIISDDGSTDNSLEIIRSYNDSRIRIVRHKENLGLISTLNEGIYLASTDLIARMDADDISYPDRLEKQVVAFENNSKLVLIGSDVDIINEYGKLISYEPKPTNPNSIKIILSIICPIAHPTVVFKKEPVIKRGGYNNYYVAEDYDLWTRLVEDGELSNLPIPLLKYRINTEGESLQKNNIQQINSRIISNREWEKYGDAGPAPIDKWHEIWPDKKHLKRPRPNEIKFYANLHRKFARCYAEKSQFNIALKHNLAAIYWQSNLIDDIIEIYKTICTYIKQR